MKTRNVFFALVICAMVTSNFVVISCSGDDEYGNYADEELETLAEGEMRMAQESSGWTEIYSISADSISHYCAIWSVAYLSGSFNRNKWEQAKEFAKRYLGWNSGKGLRQDQIQELSAHIGGPSKWIPGRRGSAQDSIFTMENTFPTGAIDSVANILVQGLSSNNGVYNLTNNILIVENLSHCVVGHSINLRNSSFQVYDLKPLNLADHTERSISFSEVSDLYIYH